ncbi:MAG: hypothetical protein M1114_05980 [Candidatus Dependentiae bacterium]|nr:hypothetical protein [Candidatus Dependentiae bacterium]
MNKRQYSVLLLLSIAINNGAMQTITYPNTIAGVQQAKNDVLAAIKNRDFKRAQAIINQGKFNPQVKNYLVQELQRAQIATGESTIAGLQRLLTQANIDYRSVLVGYEHAENRAGSAGRTVAELEQQINAAQQEIDRLQAENEQNKRAKESLENGLREAHAKLAQGQSEAAGEAEDLQQRLDAIKSAEIDAIDNLNDAKTLIGTLRAQLQQKQQEFVRANTELAKKQAELDKVTAQLNAKFAPETDAALASTTPMEIRAMLEALLQNDASTAVALPIAINNSDATLHEVARIAVTNVPVQTELRILAENNENKNNIHEEDNPKYSKTTQRAQWIIMQAAKNNQAWAQKTLLETRESFTYKDSSDREQIGTRHPQWAIKTLVALSPDHEFAFKYVIDQLEKNQNNALRAFAIEQANKGNQNFQKYIIEKAVYASWNYDSMVGGDYGIWALCAIKIAATNKAPWAITAVTNMINKDLPMFKDGYAFTSSVISKQVLDDKKGMLGGKSKKETYLEQSAKWAGSYPTYKCDISNILNSRTYIDYSIPAKPASTPMPVRKPVTGGLAGLSEAEGENILASMTDAEYEAWKQRNAEQWNALGQSAQSAINSARAIAVEQGSKAGTAVKQGAAYASEKLHLADAANAAANALQKAGNSNAAQAIKAGARNVSDWTVDQYGRIKEKAAEYIPYFGPSEDVVIGSPEYNVNPSEYEKYIPGYMEEEAAPSAPAEEENAPEPESPF